MIEFFILRAFYNKLAAMAQGKNRPRSWGWLGVTAWLVGEVLGFIIAGVDDGAAYGLSLLCAALGAGVAFLVVTWLAPLPPKDFPTASIHRGN